MAIKSKDELLASLREKIGEDTSDESIALIEDISDTFSDMETRVVESGNWKDKYEQNDAEWRQKYTERFFNPDPSQGDYQKEDEQEYGETETPLTFDDLFKTE